VNLLLRASELIGQPVVTLEGDDIAEVKDVVLGLDQACLVGFTLRGRGFLSGPLDRSLPWKSVHAVGRDAVMIEDVEAIEDQDTLRRARSEGEGVLEIEVMSDGGDRLGHVLDVIITTGRPASVVGFEIEATGEMTRQGQRLLLPADEMVSVSDRALVVPEAAKEFVRDDLTGFGAGVEEYRNQLGGRSHASQ
jgi:uncharacterized protein YrrD